MLLTIACGRRPRYEVGEGRGRPEPVVPPPSTIDAVFLLESSGVPPEDTVVAIGAGARRVIILRRGAPDNSLFAELTIPGDTVGTQGEDSLRVTVRPRPGLYSIDLTTVGTLPDGTQLAFSYGVHFVSPTGARSRYGGDLGFEAALSIATLDTTGRVVFLPTYRLGSDLMSATIPGPGRYVVAAPR